MPVPPYRPCAKNNGDLVPFQGVSHFWVSIKRRGWNPKLSIQDFLKQFSRAKISLFLERVTHVLSGLQTWGVIPLYSWIQGNVAAPKRDAPAAVQVPFLWVWFKKNYLAQQGPDEAAGRPRRGWDTSGTKNEVTNPLDMTMREKYTGFSCGNYR